MFVQAIDGKFYKDPAFFAPQAVVSCAGPICRVIVQSETLVASARRQAKRALNWLGMSGKILDGEKDKYLFDGNWKPGWSFDFVFKAASPIPEHAYCVLEPAKDEICVGFWSYFWEHELLEHIRGEIVLSLLVRALLGEWDGPASLLKRRLYKQCPDLRFPKSNGLCKRKILWNNSSR